MKRVIFTREHPLQKEWVNQLIQKGYTVEHVPLILCQVNDNPNDIYQVQDTAEKPWLFFTSQVAVDFFFEKAQQRIKKEAFYIATIGPQTSETVKKWGYSVTFQSDKFYAKDLVAEWGNMYTTPQTIYIPQSSLAAKTLENALTKAGHVVHAWVMYETVPHQEGQKRIKQWLDDVPTIWAFASGSAWDSFYQIQKTLPINHEIAVIGTTTKSCVEKDGFTVNYVPDSPLIEKMVATILESEKQ